jgi:hypothetical protein
LEEVEEDIQHLVREHQTEDQVVDIVITGLMELEVVEQELPVKGITEEEELQSMVKTLVEEEVEHLLLVLTEEVEPQETEVTV